VKKITPTLTEKDSSCTRFSRFPGTSQFWVFQGGQTPGYPTGRWNFWPMDPKLPMQTWRATCQRECPEANDLSVTWPGDNLLAIEQGANRSLLDWAYQAWSFLKGPKGPVSPQQKKITNNYQKQLQS